MTNNQQNLEERVENLEQLAEDLLNDACKSVQGQQSKQKSADAEERSPEYG